MPDDRFELQSIDRVIHEPARLLILSILAMSKEADFVYLMTQAQLTQGNLASHLGKLEGAGYVTIEKAFRGKYPLTLARITKNGEKAFTKYRKTLQRILGPQNTIVQPG